ncbi:Uncharacterized membrane protein YphA, DoxX/SURF4 family [Tessaracoccus flavus]|nr:Uncharacterized membrane protein YphA, DoxX/SURF4 family [Tessaracoccus flavus]
MSHGVEPGFDATMGGTCAQNPEGIEMSNNDWVQEGTPRDAEWEAEQDDYGVPLEQWDDYAAEQAVPVPSPQADTDATVQPTAPEVFDGDETTGPMNDEPEPDNSGPADDASAEGEAVEFAGPGVYDEPVIANDLVSEGDPVAVASPQTADDLIDETVQRPVPAPDEESAADSWQRTDQDAGSIPAPVLADEHGEPVVGAEEAAADDHRDDADGWDQVDPAADDHLHDESTQHVAATAIPGDETADDAAWAAQEAGDIDEAPADSVAEDEQGVAEPAATDDGPHYEDDPDATAVHHLSPSEPSDPEVAAFGRPGHSDITPASVTPTGDGSLAAGAVGGAAVGSAAMAGLYRGESDETQILDAATARRTVEQERADEERIARELQAEREARASRLGMVATSDANATRDPRPIRRGVGPFGSFGLFVLRLVTALILGVVGYQVLNSIDATTDYLAQQPLIPEPRLVAWIVGFGLAAMAVLLVIGLAVRVVGFLIAAVAVASLVLLRWGQFSIFVENMEGFRGDHDLLLAAVGIALLSLGGGRFGIDGAVVKARETAREAKYS